MSESEVADRYRLRFGSATSHLDRLRSVHESLPKQIEPDTEHAWLLISAVPEIPGRERSSHAALSALKAWLGTIKKEMPCPTDALERSVSTGFRRYVIGDGTKHAAAELHHDGAGAIGLAIGHDWSDQNVVRSEPTELTIGDAGLSFNVMTALLLLGAHAERVHGAGQLDVTASMYSKYPVRLGQARGDVPGRLGARSLTEFERLTNTLALSDLTRPGPELVAASYIVASDLVAGFGYPEALQMDIEGVLQWEFINKNYRPSIRAWAESNGIEIDGIA